MNDNNDWNEWMNERKFYFLVKLGVCHWNRIELVAVIDPIKVV